MIDVEQARQLYEGAEAVHDFDHVLRVLALAERLARDEGADLEIVRAAALLHDVARGRRVTTSVIASEAKQSPADPPEESVAVRSKRRSRATASAAPQSPALTRAEIASSPMAGAPRNDELLVTEGIDKDGAWDHAQAGADLARELLAGQPPEKVEAVAHAIAAHRFRRGPEPRTREARVLYDADKLDAIGAIGVARAFHYGGSRGQRLWAEVPAEYEETPATAGEHTPVHEYVYKLARIRQRLLTDSARRLAEERHAFMVAFYERLEREIRGLA